MVGLRGRRSGPRAPACRWCRGRHGLGVWPIPLGPAQGGGADVAGDDCGGEHGHLAVCLGQDLEEGFRCVAEGDVGVDVIELPSVPHNYVDAQSPQDAHVVDQVDVDAHPGI